MYIYMYALYIYKYIAKRRKAFCKQPSFKCPVYFTSTTVHILTLRAFLVQKYKNCHCPHCLPPVLLALLVLK